MTGYWITIIGTWVVADGVASLWQYTKPEYEGRQSFWRDHSFRLFRIFCGIVLVIFGGVLIAD